MSLTYELYLIIANVGSTSAEQPSVNKVFNPW